MKNVRAFEMEFAGRMLRVEIGRLAHQANGSCTVQYGDTVVLATATMSKTIREGINFFPLMVDYEEKLYAAGKIKGSRFIKREGRPTDEAVLTGRKIDRGLRPFFPVGMQNDVQIISSVLSYDGVNDPDVVAILAASIALHISDIPWEGPLAAMRVGYLDGNYILNPNEEEKEQVELDLVVSTTRDTVAMVDAEGKEASEEQFLAAFDFALQHSAQLIDFIEDIRKEVGKEKSEYSKRVLEVDGQVIEVAPLVEDLKVFLEAKWQEYLFNIPRGTKGERKEILGAVKEEAFNYLTEKHSEEIADFILSDFYEIAEEKVSKAILESDTRIDGRGITDVRDLSASVGLLPRTHGSGVFSRGETQVISTVTLGAPGDEQTLDGMEENGKKRYMHHYNFPPFSVGEVKPLRGASRRDIGHGALAEKALEPVLPPREEFPYTIRVVSEVMGSNGSSSMASACGSTLALMDAGVPIKRPVAGIAIGLASDGQGKYKVITDIQDFEDGDGGMDFKICGTTEGITAIQMDTKTRGLNLDIIKQALEQGYQARLKILDVITKTIKEPRADLSPYAPRIITMQIDPEKIREVIGPGGKMINQIIDATGVSIDIEDDGSVFITAVDRDGGLRAQEWIQNLTKEVEAGEIYEGKVTRLMDFGAFVEILPGKEGLVHVSEISYERVEKVSDALKVGQIVKVKVTEIDNLGRINLSIKRLLPRPEGIEGGEERTRGTREPRRGQGTKPAPKKRGLFGRKK